MAMNIAAICAALVMRWSWGKENKQRDAMDPQEIREKYTEQELVELGDKSPLYRYVL